MNPSPENYVSTNWQNGDGSPPGTQDGVATNVISPPAEQAPSPFVGGLGEGNNIGAPHLADIPVKVHLKKLKEILQSCKEELGLADADKGSFHDFGKVNLAKQRRKFGNTLSILRALLVDQFVENQLVSSANNIPLHVKTYLQHLSDKYRLSSAISSYSDTIGECIRIGENQITGGKYISNPLAFLNRVARELNLETDTEAKEEEDKVLWFTFCNSFLLDVIIQGDNQIEDVVLRITAEGEDGGGSEGQEMSQPDLKALIQSGDQIKFTEHLQRLLDLDELNRIYRNKIGCSPHSLLSGLAEGLMAVFQDELTSKNGDQKQVLMKGHGIVSVDKLQIFTRYYTSQFETQANHSDTNTHTAEIAIEEWSWNTRLPVRAALVPRVLDSSTSSLGSKANLHDSMMSLNSSRQWPELPLDGSCHCGSSPLSFTLKLEPAVPVSYSTMSILCDILKIKFPGDLDNYEPKISNVSLEEIICGREILERKKIAANQRMRFVFSGTPHSGLLISRLPFSEPSQLFPVLKVLRRQLLFNELYYSCFSGGLNADDIDDNIPFTLYEIISTPPYNLSINMKNPLSPNLVCLEIQVQENGELAAKFHTAPGDELPGRELQTNGITKLLSFAPHIPLALGTLTRKLLQKYRKDLYHDGKRNGNLVKLETTGSDEFSAIKRKRGDNGEIDYSEATALPVGLATNGFEENGSVVSSNDLPADADQGSQSGKKRKIQARRSKEVASITSPTPSIPEDETDEVADKRGRGRGKTTKRGRGKASETLSSPSPTLASPPLRGRRSKK